MRGSDCYNTSYHTTQNVRLLIMRYCGSIFKAADSTFTSTADHLIVVLCSVTRVSENEHREYVRIFSFLDERSKLWDNASSEGYHMQILN